MTTGRSETAARRDIGTRRALLRGGAAAGALLAAAGPAAALPRDVAYAIRQFVGAVPVQSGRVALDLPAHSDAGTAVPLTVGFDAGAAEAALPRALHVLVDGNPRPHVVSVWFGRSCGRAEFSTRIRLESAQTVTAIAELEDGTVWRADQALTVNFGACAEVGSGSDAEIRQFRPVSRVSVPATAPRGAIVPVRALVAHPMETGLRLNHHNTWIPMRIVERFTCSFDGEEIFRARPYPAIAANPYFAFFARVDRSGRFTFRWEDTDGSVVENSAAIAVT